MLIGYQYSAQVAAIHKLRVNVKSLAAEARLIRQETRRAGPAYRDALALHRRGRLRQEVRYAQLALAYVRGKPYRTVEPHCGDENRPDATRLAAKLRRIQEGISRIEPIANSRDAAVAEWLEGK